MTEKKKYNQKKKTQ